MARNPHIEAVLKERYKGRRKVPKFTLQAEPRGLERSYLSSIISEILKPAKMLIDALLVDRLPEFDRELTLDGLNLDAYPDELERIFGDVRLRFAQIVDAGAIKGLASAQGTQLDLFNRNQSSRQFKRLLGIDTFAITPQLTTEISAFTADNVGLIKSIPEQYFTQIENTALRNLRAGNRSSTWRGELAKRYDVSKSRAALIARDQTNKFNGQLNRARQTSLGVEFYFWRTSEDERVRETHEAINGNRYAWSGKPEPPEGHPGEPIQCRCQAEPDLQSQLDAL